MTAPDTETTFSVDQYGYVDAVLPDGRSVDKSNSVAAHLLLAILTELRAINDKSENYPKQMLV